MTVIYTKQRLLLESLRDIPVIPPNKVGANWKGVPHSELIDLLYFAGKSYGWTLLNGQYHISPDKQNLAASWDVKKGVLGNGSVRTLSIGLINSNSMKTSMRLYGGEWTESGGIPLEQYHLGKHTSQDSYKGKSLTERVLQAAAQLDKDSNKFPKIVDKLQGKNVSPNQAAILLSEAARKGLMPWSRIGLIDKAFREGVNNEWNLLRSFAEVAKLNPPLKQLGNVYGFVRLLIPAKDE